MFKIFEEEPAELTITEAIAAASFGYLLISSAFNTGYFNNVPGHFVQLFTLQDLFALTLPVIEYVFGVFILYSLISILSFWSIHEAWNVLSGNFERVVDVLFSDALQFKLGMLFIIAISMVLTSIVSIIGISTFAALVLPSIFINGLLAYIYVVAWRTGHVRYRTALWIVALNAWMIAYASGSSWLKSEVADLSDVQSFITKDGTCIDRKLLRAAGGGLLLYNPGLKQFEIRSRDDFKTLYPLRTCT
ncbi:hypothetical protein [Bradyrhizobium sp. SEMIA]|uniref:hypothetical protein n=1 Tax=Bradyrhizobium sp. SEMIA TaxID=2597515 RepID=UPI0018A5CAF5|nr:hypothetical protein [Bradyrhizobium sp. SEMIA]QOG21368.1 hypothetical protein FOM02_32700 [Bradyrhizobium sp. SEMIA]